MPLRNRFPRHQQHRQNNRNKLTRYQHKQQLSLETEVIESERIVRADDQVYREDEEGKDEDGGQNGGYKVF